MTATEWGNFFALRDHADAQPELAACVTKAHKLYKEHEPQKLQAGQWHLPFVTGNDEKDLHGYHDEARCFISAGRCARVSYLTHDGKRNPEADITLAKERIQPSGHMSPFEHVAQAMTWGEWSEYATKLAHAWLHDRMPPGNFWGWRQLRKTITNEHDFSRIDPNRA